MSQNDIIKIKKFIQQNVGRSIIAYQSCYKEMYRRSSPSWSKMLDIHGNIDCQVILVRPNAIQVYDTNLCSELEIWKARKPEGKVIIYAVEHQLLSKLRLKVEETVINGMQMNSDLGLPVPMTFIKQNGESITIPKGGNIDHTIINRLNTLKETFPLYLEVLAEWREGRFGYIDPIQFPPKAFRDVIDLRRNH